MRRYLWPVLMVLFYAAPIAAQEAAARPRGDVLLFNNPPVRGRLHNPFKQEDIPLEGYPFARVIVRGLPKDDPAQVELTVTSPDGEQLFRQTGEVRPEGGATAWTARFDRPLKRPGGAEVRLTQGDTTWRYRQEIRLHRLHGRITDFAGKPIAGFVMVNGYDGAIAQADADGRYEMWLPETHLPALTFMDSGYGYSSLEAWVCDYTPRHDLELNPRIGQLELYEIQAWRGYSGLKLDLIPMSLGVSTRLARAEGVGEEFGKYFGQLPDGKAFLNREDLQVELDGKPLEVHGFWERVDLMGGDPRKSETTNSRPEYTLQTSDVRGDGPRGETQVLRVVVTRRHVDGGKLVEEKGEGYYLGLRAGWSASGGAE